MNCCIRSILLLPLMLFGGPVGAAEAPAWPPGFRFEVVTVGESAVLVDTASGQSWILSDSKSSWNPMPFNSAEKVAPGVPAEAFFPPPTKRYAYDPDTGKLVPLDAGAE